MFLILATTRVYCGDLERVHHAASRESTLVGQVLLPNGMGSRGVEVMITTTGVEDHVEWVRFDQRGRFAHTFMEALTGLTFTAGAEVHRIDANDLPEANPASQIEVDVIDLRDRLSEHRLLVRAADGKPKGDVRVGMWFGPPPVGPLGEPVSLGSAQFPEVALSREMAWLVTNEAHSIYFLVERPSGSGRGTDWRSGRQRLFGPFTAAEFPAELIMN